SIFAIHSRVFIGLYAGELFRNSPMIMKFLIIACLTVSGVFAAPAMRAQAFDWKQAHELVETCSPAQAELLDAVPASPETDYMRALLLLRAGQHEAAAGLFNRVRAVAPDNIPAQWGLAEISRQRHAEGAAAALQQLIAVDESFAPAYISLAYLYFCRRQFSECGALLETLLRRGRWAMDTGTYVRAHCLYSGAKGMAAYWGGPVAKMTNGSVVLRHLKIAESILPNSDAVAFGMGTYYLLLPPLLGRDLDRAVDLLEKAVAINPLFTDAWVRLAQAYRAKGNEEKFEQLMARACELDPDNVLVQDISSGQCRFICVP
ncbi:MAG: tetratricopeptide repeat protein, partial [Candidatus Omnitrophica bacterium]|nr:tetratricopeptide repeat protein [Candidatus Omnitrophota bacterium]